MNDVNRCPIARSAAVLTVGLLAALLLACGGQAEVAPAGAADAGAGGGQNPCSAGPPSQSFTSGTFFAVWEIATPIDTQFQLFVAAAYDPATGEVVAQLTNADRNPELDCGFPCDPEVEVCSLALGECVEPTKRAQSEEDYGDFVPNAGVPTGYSVTLWGCVYEQAGSAALSGEPFDLEIQSPPVGILGVTMDGNFTNTAGVLRGSGPLAAADFLLGVTSNGPMTGTHFSRLVPPDEVPPGVPQPPAGPPPQ